MVTAPLLRQNEHSETTKRNDAEIYTEKKQKTSQYYCTWLNAMIPEFVTQL